ncbi:hypothetical protein M9H77_31489 [Catharanthus roseus]|uniref:Uncharacterized protein n=1 Tax=Catharanthus roseus TaxID=4058 RepID=A0ACC0A2X8_CATRO|nr:hypothetical protein M9H77_31489 [Catharanthus roseus]
MPLGLTVVIEIYDEDSLIRTIITSEEDAFQLYNDYAFKLGFGVRKGRKICKVGSSIMYLRQLYCYKQWKKCDKQKVEKCYSKVHIRTNCKVMIEFRLNDEDGWTVSRHNVIHNHELCHANQRHLIRSKRAVTKNHTGYLQNQLQFLMYTFFWRDGRMRCDYSDLLSMGSKQPATVMINHSAAMAAAIGVEYGRFFCCKKECVEMVLPDPKLLQRANRVYTFMRFLKYCQRLVVFNDGEHMYKIWRPDISRLNIQFISCTCKMFSEVGVLCSHCSCVFNFHYVQGISNKYVLERWTKNIGLSGGSSGFRNEEKVNKKDIGLLVFGGGKC